MWNLHRSRATPQVRPVALARTVHSVGRPKSYAVSRWPVKRPSLTLGRLGWRRCANLRISVASVHEPVSMNQSHHDHHHDHGHRDNVNARRPIHRDWRAWVIVVVLLAAMASYVLTDGEVLRPIGLARQPAPAAPSK